MEDSTAHDCDDCLAGQCEHPDHYLADADVDLDYLLALDSRISRWDQLLPETAWARGPVTL